MQLYAKLTADGVPMKLIDDMDIIGYMRVLAYSAGSKTKQAFIDDVL